MGHLRNTRFFNNYIIKYFFYEDYILNPLCLNDTDLIYETLHCLSNIFYYENKNEQSFNCMDKLFRLL